MDHLTYEKSGVSIDKATQAKKRIKRLARKTFTPNVLSTIGSFAGLFHLDRNKYKDPVLVSSVDGVGTKLKIAFMTGNHRTVGYDLVSHCINDILVQGAFPLFFLDYIAAGKLDPNVVAQIIEGLIKGCREGDCALIGGETAEMPDFYREGEYDLAGTIVGIVERKNLIDGGKIRPGDLLVGLPSLGLHTNGYSLARKIFFEVLNLNVDSYVPELKKTVGAALLAPHKNYLPILKEFVLQRKVNGLAHITGGGITDNLPRILPANCQARIELGSWKVLPIFEFLRQAGNVEAREMYRTFNMGIGMILVVSKSNLSYAERALKKKRATYYLIGEIVEGERKVVY